jgi:hypothetical protein|tara:strand:- start:4 stop:141 length:138 start_codon:yes stop_codon:yes gene_type:complete
VKYISLILVLIPLLGCSKSGGVDIQTTIGNQLLKGIIKNGNDKKR